MCHARVGMGASRAGKPALKRKILGACRPIDPSGKQRLARSRPERRSRLPDGQLYRTDTPTSEHPLSWGGKTSPHSP